MSLRPSSAWVIAFGLATLLACNRPDFSTPVKAYLSFARAVQKSDYKRAWAALSPASKQALEARAKAVSEAAGGAVAAEPAAMFFALGTSASPAEEVKLVKEEGNEALLSVVPKGGSPREVRMVKEQVDGKDVWKLDVTGQLKD